MEKFEKQFTCLGENAEKYITFTVPIEKQVTKIDKKNRRNHDNIYFTYYNLLTAQDLL